MPKWMPRAAAGLLLTTVLAGCNAATEQQAADPVCDRACLVKLTQAYVAGLEGNSAASVPFSDDVRIVENLKPIKAGDGLWKDVTGAGTDFSVIVPDEANQTAGWIGMVERAGKPIVVAVRLKLDPRGSIVEAEHLYADINAETQLGQAQFFNLQTPRPGLLADVPEANRMMHDALIRLGASYYDALDENDGSKMPFAADCERHENGMVTAGGRPTLSPLPPQPHPAPRDCAGQLSSGVFQYIDRIENRRVFAADPQTGLVMGLSHFHHPMDFPPYEVTAQDGTKLTYDRDEEMKFDPFDLPAAHIFKVGADGKVHEIEAMGFRAPLNSPSGWD
jgi:hypothetical protein